MDSLLELTECLTRKTAAEQPLLAYSAEYWNLHLSELGKTYSKHAEIDQKVYRLFTERDVYLNWMHLVDFQWADGWHKSYEELPSPLSSASVRGLQGAVERLLCESTNPSLMVKGQNCDYEAVYRAASEGHLGILELLIKTADEIPRKVVTFIMSYLHVTQANKKELPIILNLLWDKGVLQDQSRASLNIIDEELVEAAALNWNNSAYLLMSQLLGQNGIFGVRKTKRLFFRVIEMLLWTGLDDAASMDKLLDKFDRDIKLSPSHRQRLASTLPEASDPTIAIAIFERWLGDIEFSDKFVGELSRGKREVMEFLLQKHGNQVHITPKVLVQAVKEASDPRIITLLLEWRDPGAKINQDVLIATAQRETKGSEFMQILLDACGSGAPLDDEIIQEIACNRIEGLSMMKLLICRQQAGFVVTRQTFYNAMMYNSERMLELLINNASGSDFHITEEILIAIAYNDFWGYDLIKYVFELEGHDLPVSHDSLVSISKIDDPSTPGIILSFILERWTNLPVTDELFQAACIHPNSLDLLLDRRTHCLPIRKMIQKIAAKDWQMYFVGALTVLLNRELMEVDELLIEAVAGNGHCLEEVYNRHPHFLVTPKIVTAAAENVDSMRILLNSQKDQIFITEDMIQDILLGSNPNGVIDLLLTRLGPGKLPVTGNILIRVVQRGDVQSLGLFLRHYHDLNLNTVWQAIWKDPEVNIVNVARASVILLKSQAFELSENMLNRIPVEQNDSTDWNYPFDEFLRSCMRHLVRLPALEAVTELVVARSSFDTIEIFLGDRPDIFITENTLKRRIATQGRP